MAGIPDPGGYHHRDPLYDGNLGKEILEKEERKLKYLYGVKGCSHCDSNGDCPKELKNSDINLRSSPRKIKEGQKEWTTFCSDFIRAPGG